MTTAKTYIAKTYRRMNKVLRLAHSEEAENVLAAAHEILSTRMKHGDALASPGTVRDYLRLLLHDRLYEVFVVILLDAQNQGITLMYSLLLSYIGVFSMPVLPLTQQMINQLEPAPDGQKIQYCDQMTPGLLIEVRSSIQDARWYLRYKNADKKTAYKPLGSVADLSLAAARKAALTAKAEIFAAASFPAVEKIPTKAELTFSEFFTDHYLPYVKPRKRSWKRDEQLFRLSLQGEFGGTRLKDITRQQIQLFHTQLLETKLAPASCDHSLKLLKHCLFVAISWDLMPAPNPASRVPLFNVDNRIEHYLNDAELERLINVLRTDSAKSVCWIALFLLSTGARLNEALQARWDQVDQVNKIWRIAASTSKNKRVRSVPLNSSALELLKLLPTAGVHDYLFVNPKTNEKYVNVHKVWERLRIKAGLPHLRIHDLRHQYASFLVNSGRSLFEVQQIPGHSDPKVTMRYSHLSSRSLLEAANTASAAIDSAMRVPVEIAGSAA